jgi:hypothetical protein
VRAPELEVEAELDILDSSAEEVFTETKEIVVVGAIWVVLAASALWLETATVSEVLTEASAVALAVVAVVVVEETWLESEAVVVL